VKLSRKEDSTIREHLGDVYQAKGMLKEALRELERALSLDEQNATLRQKVDDTRQRLSRTPR
jgi:chemotaxis regulatin CheY-phosphate phosphatase CheZ